MKKLTLIRHAKSDHPPEIGRDFDRPLSARGLRDAPLIGQHLLEKHAFSPDRIISSPANRAYTTASLVRSAAGLTHLPIIEAPDIYEADSRSLAGVIAAISNHYQHPVLFGHCPGLENLANWLCARRLSHSLPTGGIIMLELAINSWAELDLGCATLLHYILPSEIGGGKDAHAR